MQQPIKAPYKIVGTLRRHDRKNTMWIKGLFEERYRSTQAFFGSTRFSKKMLNDIKQNRPGFGLEDYAFWHATWYLAQGLGDLTNNAGNEILYAWRSLKPLNAGRLTVDNPADMSKRVRRVAKFIGADSIGICKLNPDWVYSHSFDYTTGAHKEIIFDEIDEPIITENEYVIPDRVSSAIVLVTEMEFRSVATSPSPIEEASTGLGYSRMVVLASTLAEFIRALGYVAIPCGNDTALSIPLAIDSGLGQLGRNGLLITPELGPRVRLCKVLTDLPLNPDNPIDIGVTEFCSKCRKCAKNCPAQAISTQDLTSEGPTEENNPGVMKWYINPELCYEYQVTRGIPGCANCIMSCPFNKPRKWYHNLPRWVIKNIRGVDVVWVRLDGILGYGKRMPPKNWWKS